MTSMTISKEYTAQKRYPGSALGDYSHPTISSQHKARSRSSSQKSKLPTKRPLSRYGTINTTSENR